jgi:hypothetical protein
MMSANEVTKNLWIVKKSKDVEAALLAYFPPEFVRSYIPDETFHNANLAYLFSLIPTCKKKNDMKIIEYFFRNGASLDDIPSFPHPIARYSLLGRSVASGYYELTKFLLALGARKCIFSFRYGCDIKCLSLVDKHNLIDIETRNKFPPETIKTLDDRKNRYKASIGLLAIGKYHKCKYIDRNLFITMAKMLWVAKSN